VNARELRDYVGLPPKAIGVCRHDAVVILPIDARFSLRHCLQCGSPIGKVGRWIE